MKRKSNVFALLAILLLPFWLTGCANVSREESESLSASMIYQTPVLRLSKGQVVQTKDGQYQPQTDEVWHADARYRLLEQENIDLAAALRAKRP